MNFNLIKQDLIGLKGKFRRYTQYPHLSNWDGGVSCSDFKADIKNTSGKIGLYIHIPFCEELCSFCGCNTKITKENKFVDNLIEKCKSEIDFYLDDHAEISFLYIGGGSPNFLSISEISKLLKFIFEKLNTSENFEFCVELDPSKTSLEQVGSFLDFGVTRFIFGIQDFDNTITSLYHRKLDFSHLKSLLNTISTRAEVFLEFIYGLCGQTSESFLENIKTSFELKASGIILYPLAKVPWLLKLQSTLGTPLSLSEEEKVDMLLVSSELLEELGYVFLGQGHFVFRESKLAKAVLKGNLNRNLSTFCMHDLEALIPLGPSAIGRSYNYSIQNETVLENYLFKKNKTFVRSHIKSKEDKKFERLYLDLFSKNEIKDLGLASKLEKLISKKYLRLEEDRIKLTQSGKYVLKEICHTIDPST